MTTVFIAGFIKIKHLDRKFKERIDKIIASGFDVVVGDADGADTAIQTYLFEQGSCNSTVYCSRSQVRNDVENWPTRSVTIDLARGARAYFTAKDLAMAEVADYGLIIWDAASTGTLGNVIELLGRKRKSAVFVNRSREFMSVGEVAQLQALVARMSEHARHKADEKFNLHKKIEALSHEQLHMCASSKSVVTEMRRPAGQAAVSAPQVSCRRVGESSSPFGQLKAPASMNTRLK